MQTLKPLHEITVVFTKRTDLFHQGGTGLGQHLLTGDRFALRSLLQSFILLPACPLCTAFVINVEQLKSLTWVPARPVFLRVHITFLGWSWTGWWKSEVRGSCPSRQPAHKVCLPSSSYWCWWIRILLSILVIFFSLTLQPLSLPLAVVLLVLGLDRLTLIYYLSFSIVVLLLKIFSSLNIYWRRVKFLHKAVYFCTVCVYIKRCDIWGLFNLYCFFFLSL